MSNSESNRSVSQSLLERLRGADSGAWQRLVDLFAPQVYGWCRGAGLQPADADDVAQEVFRAVYSSFDRFQREREGQTFRGWLWRITENKIRDFHRRDQRRAEEAAGGTEAHQLLQRAPDELASPLGLSASQSLAGSPVELAKALRECLAAEFPEHAQRAFWATVVEGRDPAEVAAELGLTRNNVYVIRSRILKRLKDEFGDLIA